MKPTTKEALYLAMSDSDVIKFIGGPLNGSELRLESAPAHFEIAVHTFCGHHIAYYEKANDTYIWRGKK